MFWSGLGIKTALRLVMPTAVRALPGSIPYINAVLGSELIKTLNKFMERVMGIEPTQSAWEADVLPLNYTRTICNRANGLGYYNMFL